MKKQLLLFLMAMLPMLASAEAVEIDGIYYNLIKKGGGAEAEVTSSPNKYSGDVNIPPSVNYDGTEYSVTIIGNRAFEACSGLTSVTIPNSVTSFGMYAFCGCSGLTSITIPNSVTSIGMYAFSGCSGLTSVTIPNSVTAIGDSAFSGCSGLTSVTIPNSMTYIGNYAFYGCSGLTSVTIPNSVTSIGDEAFHGCSGLTSITIPNSVTSIGESAFQNCSGLTSITIPNSVTSIGMYAFYGCSGLTSVTIGNSVTSIGKRAFQNCSGLTSVTIPNSVTWIYEQAFANCKNLETVYCYAEKVPDTWSDAFENSYPQYMTLYVPASALNAYKTTGPWSGFGTIKSIGGGDVQKCATPAISFSDKRLAFSCETEGVEYVYEIKDADICKGYGSEIALSATYEVSVYATKSGYENSDVATAVLVWSSATLTDTTPQPTAVKAPMASAAVGPLLIQSNGGVLTVQGCGGGEQVMVYTADGRLAGSGAAGEDGRATVSTSLQPGSVAIVRAGRTSVKVMVK